MFEMKACILIVIAQLTTNAIEPMRTTTESSCRNIREIPYLGRHFRIWRLHKDRKGINSREQRYMRKNHNNNKKKIALLSLLEQYWWLHVKWTMKNALPTQESVDKKWGGNIADFGCLRLFQSSFIDLCISVCAGVVLTQRDAFSWNQSMCHDLISPSERSNSESEINLVSGRIFLCFFKNKEII